MIDWFTVAAQVFNFLILVWLLKRFLYKPILNALNAREKKIAKELADADHKQIEAGKERDKFQQKNEEFDRQYDQLLEEAKNKVRAERERLLDEARKAAEDLRRKQQNALKHEQKNLHDELALRTRKEVFAIARKTLRDLAGITLEARMSEAFVDRLRDLDNEAKTLLADALKSSSEPAFVRSACELASDQIVAIRQALNETFSTDIQLRFETVPDLISGIELSANGQKVAWSIEDYLTSLEESVSELLQKHPSPQPKDEAKDGTTSDSNTIPPASKESK